MIRTHLGHLGGPGATLRRNYWTVAPRGIIAPLVLLSHLCILGSMIFLLRTVVDYAALRSRAENSLGDQIHEVRAYVSKLQKAQRAGERALDM